MKALKLELDNFLSTNGHLNTMIPTAQSFRTTPRNYIQPVTLLYTFDLYEDKCNKFFLGRPLWYQMYLKWNKMYPDSDHLTELVRFAVGKLSGSKSIQPESIALSAFMCRFGGLTPVSEDAASNFVTNHMATTYCDIEVNFDGTKKRHVNCEITYPSEPILVEASAYLTSKFNTSGSREEHLRFVKMSIFSQSYLASLKGDVGELMANVLMCYTLDIIRESI